MLVVLLRVVSAAIATAGVQVDGVDYSRLTALLIEATKGQQAEIRQLRRQGAAKDTQLRHLTRQVTTLGARLARIEKAMAK